MRYLVIVIVLIAAAVIALFTLPLTEQGNPLLDWQSVKANWREPGKVLDQARLPWGNRENKNVTVYRWRDPAGNWQYGQIPPPDAQAEPFTVKGPDTITAEQMRSGKGLNEEQQQ